MAFRRDKWSHGESAVVRTVRDTVRLPNGGEQSRGGGGAAGVIDDTRECGLTLGECKLHSSEQPPVGDAGADGATSGNERRCESGPLRRLSRRERAVVEASVRGTPVKVIAYQLSISPQAASTYLARARTKLSVASRTGLQRLMAIPPPLAQVRIVLSPFLTRAELQIAEDIIVGSCNATIAAKRGTSVRTVENQVASILAKLTLTSRFELGSRVRGPT